MAAGVVGFRLHLVAEGKAADEEGDAATLEAPARLTRPKLFPHLSRPGVLDGGLDDEICLVSPGRLLVNFDIHGLNNSTVSTSNQARGPDVIPVSWGADS